MTNQRIPEAKQAIDQAGPPIFEQCAPINPEQRQPPDWSREKLSRLPYERRSGDGSINYGLTLPGGYWVEQRIVEECWKLFWSCAHRLNPSRKHKAEALCCDPGWGDRKRGERLKIGRCFKYFAVNGILPITLANPGKRGPRKYFIDAAIVPKSPLH